MRAAIIGVNGYLGRNLAIAMKELKWDIKGYGTKEECLIQDLDYEQVDVCRLEEVGGINTDVDYIFFFASKTGTFQAYENYREFIETNEIGLLNVLSLLKNRESQARIIFPSTRLVYQGQKGIPLNEDAPKEFKSIYALTKFFGEQALQQYQRYFDIPYTIFRICVPYGDMSKSGYSFGTVGFFLNMAKQGRNINLYGDGSLSRTFTHSYDICMQMLFAIQKDESLNSVFNIGGESLSLRDVADQIASKFNVGVTFSDWPSQDGLIESGDTIFDSYKLSRISEYQPTYIFSEWLKSAE